MKIDRNNYDKIWVGTDFHAHHNREFVWQARGFDSCQSHFEALCKELKNKLTANSLLIYLGDLCLNCTQGQAETLLHQMKVGSLMYLMGNHDQRVYRIRQEGQINGIVWLPQLTETTIVMPDGRKQSVSLCHFPLRDWNHLNHGAMHLFGHVHASYGGPGDLEGGRSLNPSYDNMGQFLTDFDYVYDLLKNREITNLHHGKKY